MIHANLASRYDLSNVIEGGKKRLNLTQVAIRCTIVCMLCNRSCQVSLSQLKATPQKVTSFILSVLCSQWRLHKYFSTTRMLNYQLKKTLYRYVVWWWLLTQNNWMKPSVSLMLLFAMGKIALKEITTTTKKVVNPTWQLYLKEFQIRFMNWGSKRASSRFKTGVPRHQLRCDDNL